MIIKISKQNRARALIFVALLFVPGCTATLDQPIHEIELAPQTGRVDLAVQLVLTDDFRKAKWEKSHAGITAVIPIGDNLVHHTTTLMQNVFTDPVILGHDNRAFREDIEVQYFIRPKVVFVEQSFGVSAFSKASTSIGVLWIIEKTEGTPIWAETIIGVGVGETGNAFTGEEKQKDRIRLAIQDLYQKTQVEILSSPLLRKLQ